MANRYGYEKGIHENDINNRGRTESPPHENINRSALDIQPTPQPRQDRVAEETPLLHGQNRQIVTEQNTPWGALLCILVFVALERFCFYVLVGAYLDPHASVLKSNPQVLGPVFVGTAYVLNLLGGAIADSVTKRIHVILAALVFYILGATFLPISLAFGNDKKVEENPAMFIAALALICLGVGGIKPNASTFGAQQFQHPQSQTYTKFFYWYFFAVNSGSLWSFLLFSVIPQKDWSMYEYSLPIPIAISIGGFVLSFGYARALYHHTEPDGNIFYVVKQLWRDSRLENTGHSFSLSVQHADPRDFKKLVVIILVLSIQFPFYVSDAQMTTTYHIQGKNLFGSNDSFMHQLPTICNALTILVLVPLFSQVVYPFLHRRNWHISVFKKMGIGIFFGAVAVFSAGVVEVYSLKYEGNISIAYQIPQFAFQGIAELLAGTGALEFAFTKAPKHLEGFCTALYLVSLGLGNYLHSLLVYIVNKACNQACIPTDNNTQGHLHYFFFGIGGLVLIDLLLFIYVCKTQTHVFDEDNWRTPEGRTQALSQIT